MKVPHKKTHIILFAIFFNISCVKYSLDDQDSTIDSKNRPNEGLTKKKITSFSDITFPPTTDINFSKKIDVKIKKGDTSNTKAYRIFSHASNREKILLISSPIRSNESAPFKLELPIGTESLIVQRYNSKNILISTRIYKIESGEISIEI